MCRGCPRAWARAIPSGGKCRTGWCRWAAGAGRPACAWPWGSAPGGWSCCGRGAPRGPASRRRRRCCGRRGAPWRRRGGGSAPGWARGPAMGETKPGVIWDTESTLGLRPLSAPPGARVWGGSGAVPGCLRAGSRWLSPLGAIIALQGRGRRHSSPAGGSPGSRQAPGERLKALFHGCSRPWQ